jgi:cobalt-zinc-cadmium efflux system outer membrane protein
MRPTRLQKTPIITRTFLRAAGLLLILTFPRPLIAEILLTESRVVELARTQGVGAVTGRAKRLAADATEGGAGKLPNPSVAWQRETVGDGGPVQDTFQVTLPIAFARPSVERSLAVAEGEMQRAEAEIAESEAIEQALGALFEVLIGERHVQLLSEELSSLGEAARILERRSAAGGAAGYESARLELEMATGRSRLEASRARVDASRTRLAALLGFSNMKFKVDAPLTLRPLPGRDQLLARALGSRRHLLHARRSVAAASAARDRAGWLWVPDLAVSGGANIVREDGTRYGYVAGVGFGLPLFSRGQDVGARADAQHALARARATVLEREVRAEVAEAYAIYEASRRELERFRGAAAPHASVMVQAARSGYREGARTVVELLDAERMHAEVGQTELGILARGKAAELRLRMATGGW